MDAKGVVERDILPQMLPSTILEFSTRPSWIYIQDDLLSQLEDKASEKVYYGNEEYYEISFKEGLAVQKVLIKKGKKWGRVESVKLYSVKLHESHRNKMQTGYLAADDPDIVVFIFKKNKKE